MFSALLSAPCELKLHLLQNAVFLRPPTSTPSEDRPPTATDEVARGMVELYVPNDRKIGGIRVKLRAVQSVALLPDQKDVISFAGATPIAWEDTVLMEKVVEIGLPKSKSHVTVPGDDVANPAERRGRSRATRSQNATPGNSRPASPTAPPDYEEDEHHQSQPNGTGGFGSAFARAISRGRQSGSRPSSRHDSRPGSRSISRSASRNASPTREAAGTTSTAQPSPHSESRPDLSPSSSSPTLTRLSSTVTHQQASPSEEYEVSPLVTSLSRTGLSNGRNQVSGPHPHIGDRDDHYGLIPPSTTFMSRGRGGAGSTISGSVGPRSATLSPSRGFSRRGRDESKSRIVSINKKSTRTASVDTAAATAPSSSSSAVPEDAGGLDLQKGVHGFEFAFILPADSPPYERSPYGRVRYLIKATAIGAGRAKSNLEAWRDLFPVVNPSPEGGPTPLTILYNDLHPTVGLVSVACTSNNISVGGIFNVDIHSPTPPTDLIVYLVRVSVETSTELRTRKRGKQYVPAQRHKLFEKGWVPPRPNDPHGPGDGKKSEGLVRDPTKPGSRSDDAWTVQGVARMPNDNVVRSSTVAGTKASIRFTHQLLVEVVHSRAPAVEGEERKLKVFALRQPITLPSCCVAYDAVTLPAYTANEDDSGTRTATMPYDLATREQGIQHRSDNYEVNSNSHNQRGRGSGRGGNTTSTSNPNRSLSRSGWTNTATPAYGVGHDFCVCGQSIQDLSERERALMPIVPHTELPLDGLSHRKIGELPIRSSSSGLRRSTSRSSSSSSNTRRSVSIGARSLSRVRTSSINNNNTTGTTSTRRTPSVQRQVIGGGERGEGVIRTMSRGSRGNELPGESQGHFVNGINNPPAYNEVVDEQQINGGPASNDAGVSSLGSIAEGNRRGRAARRPGEES